MQALSPLAMTGLQPSIFPVDCLCMKRRQRTVRAVLSVLCCVSGAVLSVADTLAVLPLNTLSFLPFAAALLTTVANRPRPSLFLPALALPFPYSLRTPRSSSWKLLTDNQTGSQPRSATHKEHSACADY